MFFSRGQKRSVTEIREPWDTGKKFVEFPYFSFETISLFMGRMNCGRCGWLVVSDACKTQPGYSRFLNISPKVRIATARYQALNVIYISEVCTHHQPSLSRNQ